MLAFCSGAVDTVVLLGTQLGYRAKSPASWSVTVAQMVDQSLPTIKIRSSITSIGNNLAVA